MFAFSLQEHKEQKEQKSSSMVLAFEHNKQAWRQQMTVQEEQEPCSV